MHCTVTTGIFLLAVSHASARSDINPLRKYTWGENIGWVSMDDQTHYVQVGCFADYYPDDVLNFFEVSAFLGYCNAGCQ